QSMWGVFYTQALVNGKLNAEQETKFAITVQRVNGALGEGAFYDPQSYKFGGVVYKLANEGTAVLWDVPVSVSPTGGGNYNLTWTPPSGVTKYSLKWCCAGGGKTIVNSGGFSSVSPSAPGGLLGFDQASTLNFAIDPATNMTWFGSNSLAPSAEPAANASSISVSTGVSGLTAPNFALKAMAPASGELPPVITTSSLPNGTVGVAYSQTLTATGDTPITWDISAGSLTACNLTLFSTGLVSGTPASATTCNFTARATNGAGDNTKALSVTINAAVTTPTVTTTTATSITTTGATSGGTVTSNGGADVTSEGVCYAITASPTTPCTSDGTATPFVSTLSGLPPGTVIHYRAFATNTAGTSYGSELTFTTTSIVTHPVRRRVVGVSGYMTSAYVQGKQNSACAGGNAACAVTLDAPLTVAADHVVILAVQSDSATTSPGAVTDGAGTTNSYTAVAPFFGGNGLGVTIFCAPVTTANTVITVAGKTVGALNRIEAAEFSGMTCTPDGSSVTGTNAASTNPVTSTGVTPSQTDLILATVFDYGGNTSLAAGTGLATDTTNLRTAY